MSKSIVIINTPEACIDCPCHFTNDDGTVTCGISGKYLISEDIETHNSGSCLLRIVLKNG